MAQREEVSDGVGLTPNAGERYEARMPSAHEDGFFAGRDGERLTYRRWAGAEPTKAVLAVLHGYLDHGGRYAHVAEHFGALGYRIYVLDQRGHGRSGGVRAFANRFGDYLDDLGRFLGVIREREGERKLFIVAHSFGALVSLRYAAVNPDGLAGIAASSPYIKNKVPVSGAKLFAAKVLSRIAPRLALAANVRGSQLTHDPELVLAHDTDPLVLQKFTTRWSTETLAAQELALAEAPRLRLPVFVMQGGADPVADPEGARAFYDRLPPAEREWRSYDGFFHEIFNEVGRERVFADLAEWLQRKL
jgi:alpha-beta hydrolase superfamily lysophospholipase